MYTVSPYLAEFLGTLIMCTIGCGVIANVELRRSKGHGDNFFTIAFGSLTSRVGVKHELLAAVPGLGTEDDAPIVHLAHEWLGTNDAPQKVTYGTEAGQFQRAGVQSIICGPGDIAQAHSPNEWIELEQLSECERFFEAILDWASAK